jgi:hypothetical protein
MKKAMWVASALLTLGLVGCDRSSSPASSTTMPESALPETTAVTEEAAEEPAVPSRTESETATAPADGTAALGGIGETVTPPVAQTESCPIAAEADAIASVEVPNGAALVFETSDPAEKRELRQELTAIANTQNNIATQQSATGINETGSGVNVGNSVSRGPDTEGGTEGRTGFEGPISDERPGGWVSSASEARAEETVKGVQLVFTAEGNVDGLRSEVRERAQELNQRCTTVTR